MDHHPIKLPGPFHQKIPQSGKTLDFYLKLLLLLLENVKHNQCLLQHCPVRTEAGRFPNFTAEAGTPFFLELPIHQALGHTQYNQLSLANGHVALPHWMKFRRQTGGLTGLALTEDCGIYHLKVSFFGVQCSADFYLHILNTTVTSKDPARDIFSCSDGETTIWANLLLQLNPVTLDASQRARLVTTMAEYLHRPPGFVYLSSRRESIMQQEEKLRVCMQGWLADTHGTEKQNVAELLWPASCQTEERLSDLAKVLKNSVQSGALARLLEAPVIGWRVLCSPGKIQHKVKRDLQKLKFTPTPNMIVPPPTQVHQTEKLEHISSLTSNKLEPSLFPILFDINNMGTKLESTRNRDSTGNAVSEGIVTQPVDTQPNSPENTLKITSTGFPLMPKPLYPFSKDVNHPHPHQLDSVPSSHKDIHQAWLSASKTKPLREATGCSERIASQSISECFPTTALCPLSDTPLPTSTLHSIYPSLPLTPASYSVTATLTHEAVDRKSPTTRLTLRPGQEETPLWTGSYRASRTDSESQPTVSSLGHIISNQGPVKDHYTAKPTLYNLPSGSHLPPTEEYNDVPLVNSTLKPIQSLPPSNKSLSTQLFPDVSPTSCLMTDRLSTTQHPDTIQHLSLVLNQDVMSQLDVTTQGASSTTWSTGETELESSLSASFFEPSVTMFTPALSSEPDFFSGQQETPSIISSPKASLSATQLLQTFSKYLLHYFGVSSLQNIESTALKDLQSITGTKLYPDQNTPIQTLSLDIVPMSLQPPQAHQTSLSELETLSHSVPSKEQPGVKSSPGSVQSMPSVQQTLHTLLFEESPQMDTLSNTFLVSLMTTSMHLKTSTGPRETSLSIFASSALLESELYFNPTAPSTGGEPYTTSLIHQVQNLDPSFPLCDLSVSWGHVYGNGCTLQIRSTSIEKTVEHVLGSSSQDEKHLNTFPSQFHSSGQFLLTQTSRNYLSMHPLSSNESMSLMLVSTMHQSATTVKNYITDTPQTGVSGTLPALEGTGFSVVTSVALIPSAFSGSCVHLQNSLLICRSSTTDSGGSVTKGRPTEQILSTSWSRLYGTSAALSTSFQAVGRSSYRESLVRPTPSSAFISSSLNLPPKVLQSIPVLTATVGFPFHYSVPPETFFDPEDGDANSLSMEIRFIDGPPVSAGAWLALDGLELHGVPLEVDLQFAPQHLLLAARDRQGLSTWLPLTLDLHRSRVDPCHVFTLTAQRSLHSVLRKRRRVELLLRKLSRFFNSSSGHHLSVVSIRPGSTVLSWYNYSLCAMGHSRNTRCNVDEIRSMWLAMRSADGSVKAAFREAMLPEFPVTKVGPVHYRQDCFSSSPPPIFHRSTPPVHTTPTPAVATNTSLSPTYTTCISTSPAITSSSQQVTNFQWMADMFTALLVICLLILIVLVVTVILHFCKGHRRGRPVAIWPAGRALLVHSRDLTAIRPRRPPLLQHEVPPPPLKLWMIFSQGDDGRPPSTHEQRQKTVDKALRPRPPQFDC